jgi:hypothetical protein
VSPTASAPGPGRQRRSAAIKAKGQLHKAYSSTNQARYGSPASGQAAPTFAAKVFGSQAP